MTNPNNRTVDIGVRIQPARKLIVDPSLRIYFFKAMAATPDSHSSIRKSL